MTSKQRLKITGEIREEAMAILSQSEILKNTVIWQEQQVEQHIKKYPDAKVAKMPYDKQMQVLRHADELFGRLNQSVVELRHLNDKYERLRLKVKEHYQKDLMPKCTDYIDPGLDGLDIAL